MNSMSLSFSLYSLFLFGTLAIGVVMFEAETVMDVVELEMYVDSVYWRLFDEAGRLGGARALAVVAPRTVGNSVEEKVAQLD